MFLEPKAYDFAQRILKIYYEKDISKEENNSEKIDKKKDKQEIQTIKNLNKQLK